MNKNNSVETVRVHLLHGQTADSLSSTTKLFFPYHWIPGEIRLILSVQLFRRHLSVMRRSPSKVDGPQAYSDNTVDHLLCSRKLVRGEGRLWSWPEGKRCALVLSHDTDTKRQEKGINMLLNLAEQHGIPSTFSFVGQFLDAYRDLLTDLRARKVEIALHDMFHDNRIAFLDKARIVERLVCVKDLIQRYEIRGFRSPSWYTSPTLWEALNELGFLYDMSALDTWSFFSVGKNYGTRTFFPFIVNDLVILPNTLPFELPWYCGYSIKDTFQFWKPKIDHIARSGGLIMINAHPDRWFCGNRRAIAELNRCLNYILSQYDPAVLQATDLARHTLRMKREGGMVTLVGSPELHVPRHEACLTDEGIRWEENPCLQEPRVFLSRA